jgi:hypothetical protein
MGRSPQVPKIKLRAEGIMSDQSGEPIPEDLAEAFCAAVLAYPDGDFTGTEPRVGFRGQAEPMTAIAHMATHFKNDQIPQYVFRCLCSYMRLGDHLLKNDLANDQSYSMAARTLLHLIKRRTDAKSDMRG